jgi:hypothetical protein
VEGVPAQDARQLIDISDGPMLGAKLHDNLYLGGAESGKLEQLLCVGQIDSHSGWRSFTSHFTGPPRSAFFLAARICFTDHAMGSPCRLAAMAIEPSGPGVGFAARSISPTCSSAAKVAAASGRLMSRAASPTSVMRPSRMGTGVGSLAGLKDSSGVGAVGRDTGFRFGRFRTARPPWE